MAKRDVAFGLSALTTGAAVATTALCCLGPLVLGGIGASSAALGLKLEPFRPWLTALTFLLVGMAFYNAYRPTRVGCETDGEVACDCVIPARRKKLAVWVLAIFALLLLTAPYWQGLWTLARL